MKMNFKITSLTLIALINLVACGKKSEGTTTGNPMVSLSMGASAQSAVVALNSFIDLFFSLAAPQAQALPPPSSLTDLVGNTVVLHEAWVSVGEIEFEASETREVSEVDGAEVELTGPFPVDLFSATPVALGYASASTSSLRRIKMKLKRMEAIPAGAPSGTLNNGVYLTGTLNGTINFSFSTDQETTIEIAGPNALNLVDNDQLLVSLHIANLIKKIDLTGLNSNDNISDATPIGLMNRCPSIDPSANDLYDCFRKGIETESNIAKDDGDGEIETGEETVD